jgi:hypothetical protein
MWNGMPYRLFLCELNAFLMIELQLYEDKMCHHLIIVSIAQAVLCSSKAMNFLRKMLLHEATINKKIFNTY